MRVNNRLVPFSFQGMSRPLLALVAGLPSSFLPEYHPDDSEWLSSLSLTDSTRFHDCRGLVGALHLLAHASLGIPIEFKT